VGDERTARLEVLFRQQQRQLCRYVYQITGSTDDAVEIVQECFLRLWRSSQPLDDAEIEPAYLYKLARNIAIDALRKKQVRNRYAVSTAMVHDILILPVTPEEEVLDRERTGLANEALGRLNDKQREMLVLRAGGLSYDEIADITGVSRGSIGQTITRALRKCRSAYEELTAAHAEEPRHASARR
jgi:RNA polymerase sigma factor (sigma-70 family)